MKKKKVNGKSKTKINNNTNYNKIIKLILFLSLFLLLRQLALIEQSIVPDDSSNNTVIDQIINSVFKPSSEHDETYAQDTKVSSNEDTNIKNKDNLVLVTRVIDGDTIEIFNGQKVRYIGIDTPEMKHRNKTIECFAQEAFKRNKDLVLGKMVRLEKDISETDKYGRLLRYVYVGDIFVNLELVKQGYAYTATYPPDVKYSELFLQAQEEARDKSNGLWESCNK